MLDEASAGVRLTYLEGTLEIMNPSPDHESLKTLLARLLEAWADETGTDLEGLASTTFRKEALERRRRQARGTAASGSRRCES